jgi:hypothetical protein
MVILPPRPLPESGRSQDNRAAKTVRDYEQQFYRVPLAAKVVPGAAHSIHMHDGYRAVHDDWLVPQLATAGL